VDGTQSSAAGRAGPAETGGPRRTFLFLQGPISDFFDRLGRTLIARGHRVHRINLHLGDRLFWHLPAANFRGRLEDWRGFVAKQLDDHRITDLVLHGDRRPYHIIAAEEARARGIPVVATDLGYVRPDWITLEYDGMTTYSRFPRDPAAIRALAAASPEPDLGQRFHTPFWKIAALDVAYNLGLVFGRPLYPGYRYHSTCHPFAEYAGWLWSRGRRVFTRHATAAEKRRLQAEPGSYFLVPLQLTTDFQIRAHSPFRDVCEAVRAIVASFAASGSRKKLVFVVHPLDNGLVGWIRFVARLARQFAVADRVYALHGGTPTELMRNAAGIVTVNSTVGVTALAHGVPVKPLGNAVFDVPGLTCQAPLDRFWHDPVPPDPVLMAEFLRALVAATQVKGGYYVRAAQDCAIAGFVARLEGGLLPLPAPAAFASPVSAQSRQTVAIAGLSAALGLAVARAGAAPGVDLRLSGPASVMLDRAAADCRYRGARVAVAPADGATPPMPAGPADLAVIFAGTAGAAVGRDDVWCDIGEAMDAVAMLAPPMRDRRRGRIILVSARAGAAAASDPAAALRHDQALVAYAAALRRRLRRHGVGVAVVVPSAAATRAAARLRRPQLTAIGADRLAARLLRRRRDAVIVVPGPVTLAWRVLRLLPARLRELVRGAVFPAAAIVPEPANDAALAEKSASGD
jgi:capsular polysaccharide export protein